MAKWWRSLAIYIGVCYCHSYILIRRTNISTVRWRRSFFIAVMFYPFRTIRSRAHCHAQARARQTRYRIYHRNEVVYSIKDSQQFRQVVNLKPTQTNSVCLCVCAAHAAQMRAMYEYYSSVYFSSHKYSYISRISICNAHISHTFWFPNSESDAECVYVWVCVFDAVWTNVNNK